MEQGHHTESISRVHSQINTSATAEWADWTKDEKIGTDEPDNYAQVTGMILPDTIMSQKVLNKDYENTLRQNGIDPGTFDERDEIIEYLGGTHSGFYFKYDFKTKKWIRRRPWIGTIAGHGPAQCERSSSTTVSTAAATATHIAPANWNERNAATNQTAGSSELGKITLISKKLKFRV